MLSYGNTDTWKHSQYYITIWSCEIEKKERASTHFHFLKWNPPWQSILASPHVWTPPQQKRFFMILYRTMLHVMYALDFLWLGKMMVIIIFFFLKLFPVSLRLYMCGCYRVETSFTFATFCGRFLSFFYSFFLHRRLLVISKTNEKGYEIMFYDLQEYVHSESLFNFLLGFICIKVYILFQQKAWVLCL